VGWLSSKCTEPRPILYQCHKCFPHGLDTISTQGINKRIDAIFGISRENQGIVGVRFTPRKQLL
jgi:hypothetical protein